MPSGPYYTCTADGRFVPAATALSTQIIPVPGNEPAKLQFAQPSTVKERFKWDGWPDGFFTHDFSTEEVEMTDTLRVQWVMKTNGGYRGGDANADSWKDGKKSVRWCDGTGWDSYQSPMPTQCFWQIN